MMADWRSRLETWWVELLFALSMVAGVIYMFYTWYAVRDRYLIFLYDHDMGPGFDASPFGWVLIDGGGLAILLVALAILQRYPEWLARGRTVFIYAHLFLVAAGIALLAAMTALHVLWRRAKAPDAVTLLVAGLDVAHLLLPLAHHLFFCTDSGTFFDAGYFRYIPSADNYFARSVWVQAGAWAAAAGIALGMTRLRAWLSSRRGG